MKKLILLITLLGIFSGVAIDAGAAARVVTTTEDLAAIVREVGGDRVTVESISKGYQDPHFVEAKPSFILRLNKADLLVVVGRELEMAWLPPSSRRAATRRFSPAVPAISMRHRM